MLHLQTIQPSQHVDLFLFLALLLAIFLAHELQSIPANHKKDDSRNLKQGEALYLLLDNEQAMSHALQEVSAIWHIIHQDKAHLSGCDEPKGILLMRQNHFQPKSVWPLQFFLPLVIKNHSCICLNLFNNIYLVFWLNSYHFVPFNKSTIVKVSLSPFWLLWAHAMGYRYHTVNQAKLSWALTVNRQILSGQELTHSTSLAFS